MQTIILLMGISVGATIAEELLMITRPNTAKWLGVVAYASMITSVVTSVKEIIEAIRQF